jgi:hypothetical protein
MMKNWTEQGIDRRSWKRVPEPRWSCVGSSPGAKLFLRDRARDAHLCGSWFGRPDELERFLLAMSALTQPRCSSGIGTRVAKRGRRLEMGVT